LYKKIKNNNYDTKCNNDNHDMIIDVENMMSLINDIILILITHIYIYIWYRIIVIILELSGNYWHIFFQHESITNLLEFFLFCFNRIVWWQTSMEIKENVEQ